MGRSIAACVCVDGQARIRIAVAHGGEGKRGALNGMGEWVQAIAQRVGTSHDVPQRRLPSFPLGHHGTTSGLGRAVTVAGVGL